LRHDAAVILTAVLALAAGPGLAAGPPVPAAGGRPNIVFILLDNCGQEWLGCYGSDEGRTPQIDALARSGVRFEHCYAPPVCGPSRTVLLTGRYLLRSGFTLHHDAALYSGGGLDPGREVVVARPFRAAGYATGIAGKWQINNLYDEPGILDRHGFDEHLVWPGSVDRDHVSASELTRFRAAIEASDVAATLAMIQKIESRYWDPVVLRNGRREVHLGRFGPDLFQEFALDFLERHRAHPFFLYYPMVLTHGQTFTQPVVPTPLDPERWTDRPHHEMYGAMVEYADRLVGQLVARLDALGLRERTIVFIATDNGTETSLVAQRRGRPAPGGLYQLTEAGSDVALVVNGPGRVPGGRTVPLADFSDVFPTLCDLAGVPVPGGLVLDGRSQAKVLMGQPGAEPPRDWIFNQYHTRRAVRDRRYKLYSTGELYDVEADREEQHDLAARGTASAETHAALARLAKVLDAMPPDAPPPFTLLSQSAFKLRQKDQP
jgi:arylsulfatase A-like enzyme